MITTATWHNTNSKITYLSNYCDLPVGLAETWKPLHIYHRCASQLRVFSIHELGGYRKISQRNRKTVEPKLNQITAAADLNSNEVTDGLTTERYKDKRRSFFNNLLNILTTNYTTIIYLTIAYCYQVFTEKNVKNVTINARV